MSREIDVARRRALKSGGGLGLALLAGLFGLWRPSAALAAWNEPAFTSKAMEDALKNLGATNPENNAVFIQLTVPEIAENGAVVPVTVSSSLPNVDQIAIMVDKNPNVLAAVFTLPQGTEALVTTRVKMGKTANIVALVRSEGKFYRTQREVKVTAGGCGG